MTCAGISSLVICGSRRHQSLESLEGERIHHCGDGVPNPFLAQGIDWLAKRFAVKENVGRAASGRYTTSMALSGPGA